MIQDVDVLAVFESGSQYPRPIRFKLFENGIKKTVSVEQIIDVEQFGAGGMTRYEYSCMSAGASGDISYRLKYYYKRQQWVFETIAEDH